MGSRIYCMSRQGGGEGGRSWRLDGRGSLVRALTKHSNFKRTSFVNRLVFHFPISGMQGKKENGRNGKPRDGKLHTYRSSSCVSTTIIVTNGSFRESNLKNVGDDANKEIKPESPLTLFSCLWLTVGSQAPAADMPPPLGWQLLVEVTYTEAASSSSIQ
ncbi:hypothetical protein Naga_100024g33 [Nannochloropsis gaditana]|uniref:Uncharacterized protein n=1 Tax=Nannochloropsis gaditana TaxID=72520 RepID=W7TPL0_9STRA|nr:hypothetical protein Naga_100024g33 [Nannochloropsis gaditana]